MRKTSTALRFALSMTVTLMLALTLRAQDAPPASPWSGSLGAGLAMTGGNTEMRSYNLSFGIVHDPKGVNLFKFDGLYLRGEKDGDLIVDKTTFAARDEYKLTEPIFAFAEARWERDRFKELDYSVSGVVGAGYKVIKSDPVDLSFDLSVGGIWERFETLERTSSLVFRAGQAFRWKISESASFTESVSGMWKEKDTSDSIYHAELALAASIAKGTELKLAFIDDYRRKPANPALKKNDTSFLAALVVKF